MIKKKHKKEKKKFEVDRLRTNCIYVLCEIREKIKKKQTKMLLR